MSKDYRAIAEELAKEVAAGRLRPGQLLPPQRKFAHQRGIATSTASRVYAELVRRGLAAGEVGRGTFIKLALPAPHPALAEPANARVDLELNFPILPKQPAILAKSLANIFRKAENFGTSLRPVGAFGTPEARHVSAAFLSRAGWTPKTENILFAGNGKQAIAAAIAALVSPGERLGVESLTYPIVKGLTSRLGIDLIPIGMDDRGLRPDALARAHRATPLRAVYLQPNLHNPLGITMPEEQRRELCTLLKRLNLFAVEDAVYSFLADGPPPLSALAPDRSILIDSLSKRLSPGLTVGFIVAPTIVLSRVATALRSGALIAPGFALEACTRWMADGTAAEITRAKRHDAAARQVIARDRLAGLNVQSDASSYHCWLTLPEPWRAETFVAAAARLGIAITPASAFTVVHGHAPNAVRLALASPDPKTLSSALSVLATLAKETVGWHTE